MTVLIGGGTGFIGSALKRMLENRGYAVTIISRKPAPKRLTWMDIDNFGFPENTKAVINCAGVNVLNPLKKWTPLYKQYITDSRVLTTKCFATAINKAVKKPQVSITVTGVGIYKPHKDTVYDEYSEVGYPFDFLSALVHQWEDASILASNETRRVVVRSGVVLGRNGGMIKQLFLPYYLGLGGPMGDGRQYMPWIHIHDLCRILTFALENDKVSGVINGVAPRMITNEEFSRAFAECLWRPNVMRQPAWFIQWLFGQERAPLLLDSLKVMPRRLTKEFRFQYMYLDVEKACRECGKLFYKEPKVEL